ncbi:MAG: GFA family protein [Lacunisphaera sp.]
MTNSFFGGCICGAVRFECTAKASEIQMLKCHCRDCQRLSGGPYTPVVYVPKRTFRITSGTIQHFETPSEAQGRHIRGFCVACGSRLTGGEYAGSAAIGMTASSLDDPSWFKPAVEMWVSDAQPWDQLDVSLPAFPKYPPR